MKSQGIDHKRDNRYTSSTFMEQYANEQMVYLMVSDNRCPCKFTTSFANALLQGENFLEEIRFELGHSAGTEPTGTTARLYQQ